MHGYSPPLGRRLLRSVARTFVRVSRLTGGSLWANEVLQAAEPTATVRFDGRDWKFRTGNGRLLWHVRSFLEEEPLMLRWISSMRPDDVVLDIGANVGKFAVAIAGRAKCVYACELDPLNVGLIHENAVLNGVQDRVVVLPIACGAADGVVDVHFRDLSAGDALQSIGRRQPIPTRYGSRPHISPVLSLSLDELWDRSQLPRPTKIKIDVDGNERTVLAGARRLCESAHEIYYEDTQLADSQQVLAELLALGFDEVDRASLGLSTSPGAAGVNGYNRLLRRRDS